MRAPILVFSILLLLASASLAPTAAAERRPGCEDDLRLEEACDVYAARDEAVACAKDLRWCIFGPI